MVSRSLYRFVMFAIKALTSLLPFLGLVAAAPVPEGGIGVRPNDTAPQYIALSDYDFQSYNLALNQEWVELDLFNYGVSRFTPEEFASQGLNAEDISLIQFMAEQEIGHATLISNILQGRGAKPCTYKYNFETVQEFVAFCQALTRWGESGVIGYLQHTNARDASSLVTQSIMTEARQQMAFRQFSGAQGMDNTWFITGITQSMAWTLLSPYIISCPAENPRIEWQNFPGLNITNNPSIIDENYKAAITHNRTAFTSPGYVVNFEFEAPGKTVGYDDKYNTTVGANVTDMTPKFAAFISQLNVTYSPLTDVTETTASAVHPEGIVFDTKEVINGTQFIVLTDTDLYVTPYNLSLLNDHIIAGPAIYQSG